MAAPTTTNEVTVRRLSEVLVGSDGNGGIKKAVDDKITAAVEALDVAEVGGDGKYLKKIKEVDGKITATVETMDTSPTASSTKAVTSGAVYSALDTKVTARAATTGTVQEVIQELRKKPGGSIGSVMLTSSTITNITISSAWYNYIWLPHRNGAAADDNQHFGTLILTPLTSTPDVYVIEGQGLASSPVYRAKRLATTDYAHDHYRVTSVPVSNMTLPNYAESTVYKNVTANFGDFCRYILLYDISQFYDGTIVNVGAEHSCFYGDVSTMRLNGWHDGKFAKVYAGIGYAASSTGIKLYTDSDTCIPAIVKNEAENISGAWTADKGILLEDVGSTVSLTPITASGVSYQVIDCTGISELYVNIGFYTSNYSKLTNTAKHVWAFVNSSNVILSESSTMGTNAKITVPTGATKMICNVDKSYSKYCYVGKQATTPKYYLALRPSFASGTIQLFGRFYTRTTATSSYNARPLLMQDIVNIGSYSTSDAPIGWSINTDGSYFVHANKADNVNVTKATTTKLYLTGVDSDPGSGTYKALLTDTGIYADTTAGKLVATTFSGNLTGNVTGNVSGSSGSCTGNAATATTATNANITKTTDTTNGDKLQIGNGTAVNITNAKHSASADSATSATSATNVNLSGDVKTTSTTNGDTIRVKAGSGTAAEITITNAKHAASADSATSATTATDYNTSTGTIKSALDGKASSTHTHGNITNAGTITADTAIASGTKIATVGTDNKVSRSPISFDGSTTITALTPKGTFEAFAKSGDITSAINALDVSSVGGAGKYISAISEQDGKISATATSMDTAPTASSTNAVTSGGIKTALDEKVNVASVCLDNQTTTILSKVQELAATPGNHYCRWYTTGDNAAENISDKPGTGKQGFVVEALCNRRGSAADWRYVLLGYSLSTKPKIAWVTNSSTSISWSDLDSHWTTHLYAGSGTAANAETTNGNTKITVTDNSTVRNSVTLTGTNGVSVASNSSGTVTITGTKVESSSTNGNIKINDTETTVYTHPTTAGNKHVPSGGSSGNFLKYSAAGTATWSNIAASDIKSGQVAVANGGTGASDALGARTNLSVYSKSEVDSMLGGRIEIVASLPSTGSPGVIYYVGPSGSGGDQYDEYIWDTTSSSFIKVGEHSIDLSNYVNTLTKSGSGSVVTNISKSGNTITWTQGNISLDNLSTWASTSDVTISSKSYHTYWPIAPTSSNQVYGVSITDGKLYQIYNNKGTYSVRSYDQDNNTTYTNEKLGQGYGTCTTEAATAAKVASLADYVLVKGGIVAVKFTNGLCASATLNVNSQGAKAIYIHGAAATATTAKEVKALDVAYFMYDGTYYQFLGTDRVFKEAITGLSISGKTITYTKADGSTGTITTQDTTYEFDGTYNASTNKAATVSTVTSKINALDVSDISGFGAGKTLATLTETDGKIAATFQNISITKSQVSDFPTSMTPTSHASSATTYGIGTTANYGHVKLATGDMNGATHADGVAVSKNHTHSQYQTVLTEMTTQEVDDLLAVLT